MEEIELESNNYELVVTDGGIHHLDRALAAAVTAAATLANMVAARSYTMLFR